MPNLSKKTKILLSLFAVIIVTACAGTQTLIGEQVAMRLASPVWMIKREITAGPFTLTAFERMHPNKTQPRPTRSPYIWQQKIKPKTSPTSPAHVNSRPYSAPKQNATLITGPMVATPQPFSMPITKPSMKSAIATTSKAST